MVSNAPGYGSRTKLAQVYPYKFCQTLTDCLTRLLGRQSCSHSVSLTVDLLDYVPVSIQHSLLTFSEEAIALHMVPLQRSLLKKQPECRHLFVKLNALPSRTEIPLHYANSNHPRVAALVRGTVWLRKHMLPHCAFSQCSVPYTVALLAPLDHFVSNPREFSSTGTSSSRTK